MPGVDYTTKALKKVLELVEACDPKNQPSDELCRTLIALADRKSGLQKKQVEEFMSSFKSLDTRLRRLEVASSVRTGRRGPRAAEA